VLLPGLAWPAPFAACSSSHKKLDLGGRTGGSPSPQTDAAADSPASTGGGVAADSRPDSASPTACNLIVNGNAEAAIGSADGSPVATPGWTSTGEATAGQYGVNGWPALTDPGPADRGLNLFSGGAFDATSSLTQTVNVNQFASTIDASQVTYVLSGWLGGFEGQDDSATLTVTFQSASGTALGTGSIGPVTSSDRSGVTGLLQRSSTGAVPAGTRTVSVVLSLVRTEGWANDGYTDVAGVQWHWGSRVQSRRFHRRRHRGRRPRRRGWCQ
jgi:hypothetical protein